MGKTLLLADDSVTIQKVVGISFASEDIAITTVDNGDDALTKAKELRPDVVLADVVMPGKSGYEVCEAIKADAELRHIPVLLLTGTFEAFDEERSKRVGASGHIAKPFEAQTLVGRVKELLAQTPSEAPAVPEAAPSPEAALSPEVAPSPEASDFSGDENSFDFFDDNAEDGAMPDTALDGATGDPSLDESLSMDSSDAAFAFGDDDLEAPAPTPSPPESTVAILPDEPAPDAALEPAMDPALAALEAAMNAGTAATPDANTPAPSADAGLTVLDPAMMGGAGEPSAAMPAPAAEAPADDGFDFEFESGPSPEPASDPPVVSEDIGHATILDPDLGADFAISSSDLDPTPPPAPEPDPAPPAVPPAAPPPEPEMAALDDVAGELLAAEPLDESPPLEGPGGLVEAPTVEVGESEAIVMAEAAPEDTTGPVGEAPPPLAEPEWTPPAPPAQPVAAAEFAPPSQAPDALAAEPIVEKIAPALRAELHETLEKIAWESFGPLTEKIVQEVIQQLETVAWDVVPKLAETLILEEIRKLKGGVE
jgi:CheY-like chemotaxis protein